MNGSRHDWMALSTDELRRLPMAELVAVLPVAAVEQHGPHLPLGTDVFIMRAYLRRVAELLGADEPVLVLPVQSIGKSDEHSAFPGTLSLPAEVAIRAWTGLGEDVHRAGVRKLVIVSSHGGNSAVMDIVAQDLRVRLGLLVVTVSWQRFGYPPGLFSADEISHGIHGGEIETSLMLAAEPALVRMDQAADFASRAATMERDFAYLRPSRPAGFGWMSQDLNPAGVVGNAAAASAEKGEAALAHGAAAFVRLLGEVRRFSLEG